MSSRSKTMLLALTFAVGSVVGAVHLGQLAFGVHDAAPQAIALDVAAAQPENRWATLRGRVDAASLMRESHPLGSDQVAFRLAGAGDGVIVLTNVKRHRELDDNALWRPGFLASLANAAHPTREPALSDAAAQFLDGEHAFTGVITSPGVGMNREDEVELDGDRFKVTGLLGSY